MFWNSYQGQLQLNPRGMNLEQSGKFLSSLTTHLASGVASDILPMCSSFASYLCLRLDLLRWGLIPSWTKA